MVTEFGHYTNTAAGYDETQNGRLWYPMIPSFSFLGTAQPYGNFISGTYTVPTRGITVAPRHFDGTNILFVDGHVKYVVIKDNGSEWVPQNATRWPIADPNGFAKHWYAEIE
jgi:prepilin-type processing-associated H-X9-DG protein